MKYSFEPVIDANARALILGTMPGDESLRLGQYYANPRNQFWTILSAIYAEKIGEDYYNKIEFLHQKRLAIWDVLQSADRDGSTDNKIKASVPNDFSILFSTYPLIILIAFNGLKAEKFFNRLVIPNLSPKLLKAKKIVRLPSTSPIPGKYNLSLEEKIKVWKVILSSE